MLKYTDLEIQLEKSIWLVGASEHNHYCCNQLLVFNCWVPWCRRVHLMFGHNWIATILVHEVDYFNPCRTFSRHICFLFYSCCIFRWHRYSSWIFLRWGQIPVIPAQYISMGLFKKDVTPLVSALAMELRFLALSHRYDGDTRSLSPVSIWRLTFLVWGLPLWR